MGLTPQQEIASTNKGGNLLVSAAAGSGKTMVLVERLMGYLSDGKTNLDDFLIITYTKAAAAELRVKIAKRLTKAIADSSGSKHLQQQTQRLYLAKISTVHGFCADVVREFANDLKIPGDFRVADENECAEIREQVLSDLLDRAYRPDNADDDFRAFVDTQGVGRNDSQSAEIVLKVYDSAMCHPDPEAWLEKCLRDGDVQQITDASQTVWGQYLMEEFFSHVDLYMEELKRCIALAQEEEAGAKVEENLADTLHQLEFLRQSETWDQVIHRGRLEYKTLRRPKEFDEFTFKRIQDCRTACKDKLKKRMDWFTDSSEQVLADLAQSAAAGRGLIGLVRQFRAAYAQAKRQRRCVDFSDLEHLTLDLLWHTEPDGSRKITEAARALGKRFREIMVDEYQDSNGVQDSIFSALTADKHNCFMVGDVKQSIYQFRLADPGIFLQKYASYAPVQEAEDGEGRKVMLSANFRSGPEILAASNQVFETCMCLRVGGLEYGEDEALHQGGNQNPLPDAAVELHCIDVQRDKYTDEPEYVAERISRMLREGTLVRDPDHRKENPEEPDRLRPVQPEDIVILLRSPGSVGLHFQRALEARGIRCTTGGGTDLLKEPEIQILRALLQTVSNPRQDIPLVACLASPVFGFSADDLAMLRSRQKSGPVFDTMALDDNPRTLEFLAVLAKLRRAARMDSIAQLIQKIFAETRMDSIFAAMADGDVRKANLQAFYQLAADYENGSHRDLEQFLEYLALQEKKGLKVEGEHTAGAVTIMSIHKSKGLEFPVVFLCGLSRAFNTEDQRANVLCDKTLGLGLCAVDQQRRARYGTLAKRAIKVKTASESLSEEMRVLYVAMTRPKDRLIMTYAADKMPERLEELARQMIHGRNLRLIREVSCPGVWVLLTALRMREAASLLQTAELRAECTAVSPWPWKIVLGCAPEAAAEGPTIRQEVRTLPADAEARLLEALSFRYTHEAATRNPSKQTATQRKGRAKDQEAAEDTEEPPVHSRSWRTPTFMAGAEGGKDYGNTMHAVMQYIRFEACGSLAEVQQELDRLMAEGFLTAEQRGVIRERQIANFFASSVGVKLRGGTPYLREFKFSILDEGSHYLPELDGEQVLLQGVVDCALLEDDGITVVDFKTDRVTDETVADAVARYRIQVDTYAEALRRIYGKPIKAAYLYFFKLNRLIPV